MSNELIDIIRRSSSALEPVATDLAPQLPTFSGIRAVLFDIYGTLLISGSGDISLADPSSRGQVLVETLQEFGVTVQVDGDDAYAEFRKVIDQHHQRDREKGIEFPEVDIVAVWAEALARLFEAKALDKPLFATKLPHFAVQFEVRVNPVWTMPGLLECLSALNTGGMILGIISNAQFFTPLVFPALVEKNLDELRFSAQLRYYSYEHRRAKPGLDLYEMAREGTAALGLKPAEVLYVGNDMRNDIWPAAHVGFRTALFAGDQRSLRLRTEMQGDQPGPDAIVTHLLQIPEMILS